MRSHLLHALQLTPPARVSAVSWMALEPVQIGQTNGTRTTGLDGGAGAAALVIHYRGRRDIWSYLANSEKLGSIFGRCAALRATTGFKARRSLATRMGILSDADILQERSSGALGLDPFADSSLTPNGYDLRIAEVMLPDASTEVYREGKVVVPAQTRFLVSTMERVKMPSNVTGQLWIRSSYARRGVLGAFGKIEAGFEGTLTVGGFNSARTPLDLPIGDRFCQVVFERMESVPRKLYAERSGNYQNQSGVTLARDRS